MKPKKRIKSKFCKLGTSKENVVAYCVYHKSTLSLRQMKAKKCLAKNCSCLLRTESHPYWAEREAIKLKRKERDGLAKQTEQTDGRYLEGKE